MVLLDICFVPCAFGLAWCCLGGTGAAIRGATTCCRCNQICPYEEDDERPRKMTKEEIERYNNSK
jgi:hypothetical protein